jgi:hypothetical protein
VAKIWKKAKVEIQRRVFNDKAGREGFKIRYGRGSINESDRKSGHLIFKPFFLIALEEVYTDRRQGVHGGVQRSRGTMVRRGREFRRRVESFVLGVRQYVNRRVEVRKRTCKQRTRSVDAERF